MDTFASSVNDFEKAAQQYCAALENQKARRHEPMRPLQPLLQLCNDALDSAQKAAQSPQQSNLCDALREVMTKIQTFDSLTLEQFNQEMSNAKLPFTISSIEPSILGHVPAPSSAASSSSGYLMSPASSSSGPDAKVASQSSASVSEAAPLTRSLPFFRCEGRKLELDHRSSAPIETILQELSRQLGIPVDAIRLLGNNEIMWPPKDPSINGSTLFYNLPGFNKNLHTVHVVRIRETLGATTGAPSDSIDSSAAIDRLRWLREFYYGSRLVDVGGYSSQPVGMVVQSLSEQLKIPIDEIEIRIGATLIWPSQDETISFATPFDRLPGYQAGDVRVFRLTKTATASPKTTTWPTSSSSEPDAKVASRSLASVSEAAPLTRSLPFFLYEGRRLELDHRSSAPIETILQELSRQLGIPVDAIRLLGNNKIMWPPKDLSINGTTLFYNLPGFNKNLHTVHVVRIRETP